MFDPLKMVLSGLIIVNLYLQWFLGDFNAFDRAE